MNRADLPRLMPLLDCLAAHLPDPPADFHPWQMERILGGQNNLLFRATADGISIAIKFTRRDARDRAGREFAALAALQALDPTLAPAPLLLDQERYPYPVVVQSGLPGACHAGMPETWAEWERLLDHLRAIHRIRPAHTSYPIQPGVLSIASAREALARVLSVWQGFAARDASPLLHDLMDRLQRWQWPEWSPPEPALCRLDPNILNFVRSPTRWASVDWENSGWGDPAFEVGDLMAHPAYTSVPGECWARVIQSYGEGSTDRTLALRLRTYHLLMLAYWAVFFARRSHEYVHGHLPEQRLVSRPIAWYATLPEQAAHYLERATETWRLLLRTW